MRQALSPNAAGFGRPDWVMCGCPAPGGVRLLPGIPAIEAAP